MPDQMQIVTNTGAGLSRSMAMRMPAKPLLLVAFSAALFTTTGCGFISHAVVHDAIHYAEEDHCDDHNRHHGRHHRHR